MVKKGIVKEIMTVGIESISGDANLKEAAKKMKDLNIGSLIVIREGGGIPGIITDRDIVINALAEGKCASKTKVNEIITRNMYFCLEGDSIADAAKIMQEKSVRRLLVVRDLDDTNVGFDTYVGFLALSDIAVKTMSKPQLIVETLKKLSEPACPNR